MNMRKPVLIFATLFLLGGAMALWLMHRRSGTREPVSAPAPQRLATVAGQSKPTTIAPVVLAEVRSALPEVKLVPAPEPPAAGRPIAQPATNATQQAGSGKKELLDPLAREALIFVGADAEAEAYWFGAINDPTLPPNERQDLIEDLNEEGLSDPKNPSPEDLPLILSRIDLIEEVGPYAMDEVNFKAFLEAYKDLWNMRDLAMGGGQPVR